MWRSETPWSSVKLAEPSIKALDQTSISIKGIAVDTIVDYMAFGEYQGNGAAAANDILQPRRFLADNSTNFWDLYAQLLTAMGKDYPSLNPSGGPVQRLDLDIEIHSIPCLPYQEESLFDVFRKTIRAVDNHFAITWAIHKGHNHCVLLRTETGYLGLASHHTRLGDRVVIFDGANTPFIIRKHKTKDGDQTGRYLLVCDCYLHGWMDGSYFGHKTVDLADGPCTSAGVSASTNVVVGRGKSVNASDTARTVWRQDFVVC